MLHSSVQCYKRSESEFQKSTLKYTMDFMKTFTPGFGDNNYPWAAWPISQHPSNSEGNWWSAALQRDINYFLVTTLSIQAYYFLVTSVSIQLLPPFSFSQRMKIFMVPTSVTWCSSPYNQRICWQPFFSASFWGYIVGP